MHIRKIQIGLVLTAATIVALVAFGGLASAAVRFVAQTPTAQSSQANPHPIRLAGTVSSVSSGSLVLAARQGNYTINVGANTWIVVQQNGAAIQGSLSDIVTGKPAIIAGMTSTDPTVVDARIVAQGKFRSSLGATGGASGQFGARGQLAIAQHAASGSITSISGSTITLKGAVVPQVIVQTTVDTIVLNSGFATIGSLKVGDTVQVFGTPVKPATTPGQQPPSPIPGSTSPVPASRTIDAWAVRVDNGSSQLMVGHVTNVSGNTLTVKTPARKKAVTITVDASTGYKTLSKANKTVTLASGSLSDVTLGSNLIIEGTPNANGTTFAAGSVIVLPGSKKQPQ